MTHCRRVHRHTLPVDVTILQQINGNPQPSRGDALARRKISTMAVSADQSSAFLTTASLAATGLRFTQLGDAVSEPRHLTPRRVAVHDVFLRCTNDDGFGFRHRGERTRSIARADRFFDFPNNAAQARAPRLVDDSAAHTLTCGLLG